MDMDNAWRSDLENVQRLDEVLIDVPEPPGGKERVLLGRRGHARIPDDEVWRAVIMDDEAGFRLVAVEPRAWMAKPRPTEQPI